MREILGALEAVGETKCICRNEYAVHEQVGQFTHQHLSGHAGLVLNPRALDLRLFLNQWASAFHISEATARGERQSIQFFDHHGDALLKGIQAMGLETFGDLKHKMNNVLGVVIPQGVNGDQVRKLMLEDFGIEIGTSFGPLHGKVWRIGTMGYNARKDCVMTTLSALESVLNYLKFTTTQGAAMQAAWDHYRRETPQ